MESDKNNAKNNKNNEEVDKNDRRNDAFGNIIVDKGKAHQIVFNHFRTEVIEVENWKDIN